MTAFIGGREFSPPIGGAATWPLVARAQQPAMPVVALVSVRSAVASSLLGAAFLRGLNETGTIEGQNVTVEYHWLEGQHDRLPKLLADLLHRQVAVIATTGNVAHVLEPIAQIIGRPDSVGIDQSEIPNEDAKSLVFDDTILFDIDKFSGYDRIETGTRGNVGVRYTAQLPAGAYARAVFGESYQLAGQNPFDENSGLGTTSSDYVSGLYLQAARYLSLTGQARFNVDTFDLMRTDLGSTASVGPVDLTINYAEVAPEAVTPDVITPTTKNDDQERRQEIVGKGTLALTDTWALLGAVRYDLQNAQTISDGVGLQYKDDCLTLAVTYEQSNIQDQDIQPEQRVMVNLALKYLGTYQYETDAFSSLNADAFGGTSNN